MSKSGPQAQTLPFVSVTIMTYNAGRTLRSCLSSILSQEYPKDLYEILMVDTGSTDDTIDIAKELPIRLIQTKKVSRGESRNICIENARGEIVAMIDADVVIPKGWLKKAVEILRKSNASSITGPYVTPMPNLNFLGQVIYYITSGWQAHLYKAKVE